MDPAFLISMVLWVTQLCRLTNLWVTCITTAIKQSRVYLHWCGCCIMEWQTASNKQWPESSLSRHFPRTLCGTAIMLYHQACIVVSATRTLQISVQKCPQWFYEQKILKTYFPGLFPQLFIDCLKFPSQLSNSLTCLGFPDNGHSVWHGGCCWCATGSLVKP